MVNSESKGIAYKIVVGKSYLEEKEELYNPSGRQEIKIIPVVLGAKKSGLGMILLGAVLIMAPMFAPQMFGSYGAGTAMTAAQAQSALITGTQIGGSVYTGFAATLAQASMKIGIGLVLSGVASLLAPTPPKPKERPEDIPSYGFDGPANTTRQGVPIPICYGQLIVGGAVISSGIEPEDYDPTSSSGSGSSTAGTLAMNFSGNVDNDLYIKVALAVSGSHSYSGTGTSGTLESGANAQGILYDESPSGYTTEGWHGDLTASINLTPIDSSTLDSSKSHRANLDNVSGRNSVTIVSQPSSSNSYITIIRIADGDYSEGNYSFDVRLEEY